MLLREVMLKVGGGGGVARGECIKEGLRAYGLRASGGLTGNGLTVAESGDT